MDKIIVIERNIDGKANLKNIETNEYLSEFWFDDITHCLGTDIKWQGSIFLDEPQKVHGAYPYTVNAKIYSFDENGNLVGKPTEDLIGIFYPISKMVSAIKIATNDFKSFNDSMSTLMGYIKQYDNQGRLITADPNIRSGNVIIDNVKFYVLVRGWIVRIYVKDVQYTAIMTNNDSHLVELNIKPDYVV